MNALLFLNIGMGEIIVLLAVLTNPLLVVICLVNLMKSTFKDSNNKLIWVLIIIFVPFIGPILYLLIGDKNKLIENDQL